MEATWSNCCAGSAGRCQASGACKEKPWRRCASAAKLKGASPSPRRDIRLPRKCSMIPCALRSGPSRLLTVAREWGGAPTGCPVKKLGARGSPAPYPLARSCVRERHPCAKLSRIFGAPPCFPRFKNYFFCAVCNFFVYSVKCRASSPKERIQWRIIPSLTPASQSRLHSREVYSTSLPL